MARATTCCETCAREAARRSTVSGSKPSAASTQVTCGVPLVSVPVLSNSMVRTRASRSSAPPPLTMMPRLAARETPQISAIGAARIIGQGVATTSTASARLGSPASHQAAPPSSKVAARKTSAQRSARRTSGGRSASADCTRRTTAA